MNEEQQKDLLHQIEMAKREVMGLRWTNRILLLVYALALLLVSISTHETRKLSHQVAEMDWRTERAIVYGEIALDKAEQARDYLQDVYQWLDYMRNREENQSTQ